MLSGIIKTTWEFWSKILRKRLIDNMTKQHSQKSDKNKWNNKSFGMFLDELIETTIIGLIFLINFFLWYGDYEPFINLKLQIYLVFNYNTIFLVVLIILDHSAEHCAMKKLSATRHTSCFPSGWHPFPFYEQWTWGAHYFAHQRRVELLITFRACLNKKILDFAAKKREFTSPLFGSG